MKYTVTNFLVRSAIWPIKYQTSRGRGVERFIEPPYRFFEITVAGTAVSCGPTSSVKFLPPKAVFENHGTESVHSGTSAYAHIDPNPSVLVLLERRFTLGDVRGSCYVSPPLGSKNGMFAQIGIGTTRLETQRIHRSIPERDH